MYGRNDLAKITSLTNLSAILRTIKKCLGTPLVAIDISEKLVYINEETCDNVRFSSF